MVALDLPEIRGSRGYPWPHDELIWSSSWIYLTDLMRWGCWTYLWFSGRISELSGSLWLIQPIIFVSQEAIYTLQPVVIAQASYIGPWLGGLPWSSMHRATHFCLWWLQKSRCCYALSLGHGVPSGSLWKARMFLLLPQSPLPFFSPL